MMQLENSWGLAERATTRMAEGSEANASELSDRNTAVQKRKLSKAAMEFESILISSFWKSMKESFSGDDEQATDPAHSTLDDLGIQAMAGAVAKAGGLGLGELIIRHLGQVVRAVAPRGEGREQ